MPTQSVESLREGFAVEVSIPIEWLWTWGGVYFGYRKGEWLFSYEGIGVGRFVGDEVFDANGKYLGELGSTGQEVRLTASNYKNNRVVAAFSPKAEKAYERRANRFPEKAYCGYQDFPLPESFKKEVKRTLHSRDEILSILNTKTGTTPSARSNSHVGTQAFTTVPQAELKIEHAVSVNANALAKLVGTSEPHNGGCEIENSASESGDEVAPPQADHRAENLRQVLLNIKGRRMKAELA